MLCLIIPIIAYIIYVQFSAGVLKFAKFLPIFKEGDKQDINHYHLISILTAIGRSFDKAAYQIVIEHLN